MRLFWLCLWAATLAAQRPATPPRKTDEWIEQRHKRLAASPADPRLQLLLAKAYLQKVRESADFSYLDRAAKLVERVLGADPGHYDAMRLRTEIELERHQFAQAAEYSEELAKLAPNDPWNWGTLGDASMELGQTRRAGEAYARMIRLRPNLDSYNRLSYFLWVTGDAAGAVAALEKAIEAGSGQPEHLAWCLADLGHLYFKLGKLDQAGNAFSQALRSFARYPPALAGLGRVEAARGRTGAAVELYLQAQAAAPLPEYTAALESLYLQSGRPEKAAQQADLLDLFDNMARSQGEKTDRKLAVIYADRGRRLDRALALAQAELRVRQDVYTYDAMGWVLFRSGRAEEAEPYARRALSLGTPEPLFQYHAGRILLALGKPEEARELLRQALALNPAFDLTEAAWARAALSAPSSSGKGNPDRRPAPPI
jgi:tetratricopeptide (TPR) repeat protein